MNKRILVLYTGGTIGMHGRPRRPGSLADLRANIPQLTELPYDVEYEEFFPDGGPIDSSNASRETINNLAQRIGEVHDQYDGIVVVYGTDTMAPTAAAVDYLLEGLQIPVVFTGSMKPATEADSDGPRNLVNAIHTAATAPIKEVVVSMWDRLIRATQAHKGHSDAVDTFVSLDGKPIGTYDAQNTLYLIESLLLPQLKDLLTVRQEAQVPKVAPWDVDKSQFVPKELTEELARAFTRNSALVLFNGALKPSQADIIESAAVPSTPIFYLAGTPLSSRWIRLNCVDDGQQALSKAQYLMNLTDDTELLRKLAEANLRGEGSGDIQRESDILREGELPREGLSELGIPRS